MAVKKVIIEKSNPKERLGVSFVSEMSTVQG
jgi:hypothetical protein